MVNLTDIIYMTNDDYAQATGTKLNLSGNDIALCSFNIGHPYKYDSLKVGGRELKVKDRLTDFPVNSDVDGVVVNVYGVVVADQSVLDDIDKEQRENLRFPSAYTKRLSVRYTDYKEVEAVGMELDARIHELLRDYVNAKEDTTGAMGIRGNNRWETAEFMYGMDGVLLFLGLILGVAFLFTTVLIIYYKQISEGYEDRERFQIMEKIGMSADEVKKTIRLQILLVFFLPLVVSAIHVAVAFHIIELLLHILLMSDTALFLRCSIYAFLGFALVYTMIYMVTARTYYKIVHN